jgi:hypothetical protein
MKMYAFYSKATGLIIGKLIPVHIASEEPPRPVQITFRDAPKNWSAEHHLGAFQDARYSRPRYRRTPRIRGISPGQPING